MQRPRLDRAAITGRSFPRTLDGYDRDAVDAHLAAIADALEQQEAGPVGPAAGEQLRRIVDGAQDSARALREAALREADELREAARREVEARQNTVAQQSGEQLTAARLAVKSIVERVQALQLGVDECAHQVQQAAAAMAARLGADSAPLVRTLRERAEALGAELDLIGSGLAGAAVEAAEERAQVAPAPSDAVSAVAAEPHAGHSPAAAGTGLTADDLGDAAKILDGDLGDRAPEGAGGVEGGAEGAEGEIGTGERPAPPPGTELARLVALNMAHGGTSRAETDRHLREELQVDDPAPILDEVYDRAEQDG